MIFRAEFFNAFNNVTFGRPGNNFSSSARGQVTTLAVDPRQIQFALRYEF